MIWTAKHDEAIEKTYHTLVGKMKHCDSRKECQQVLADARWAYGPYSELAPIQEVVQKVLGNRAILEQCRKRFVESQ